MDIVTARSKVRRRQRATRTADRDSFALGGGLNLIDPPLTIKPGYALDGTINYEIGVDGGYERLGGIERFDGQTSPSDAEYWVLPFRHGVALSAEIQTVGEAVTGADTGAASVIDAVELAEPSFCENAYSNDFSKALYWSNVGTTVAAAPSVDPPTALDYGVTPSGASTDTDLSDSGVLAPLSTWLLLEGGVQSFHQLQYVGSEVTNSIGTYFTMSVFVKYHSRRYVMLDMNGDLKFAVFDLVSKAVVTSGIPNVTSSGVTAGVVDHGDGWVRIWAKMPASTSSTTPRTFKLWLLDDTGAFSYTSDVTKGVYVAGFNVAKSVSAPPPVSPYVDTLNPSELPLAAGLAYVAMYGLSADFTSADGTQGALSDSAAVVVGTWSGPEILSGAPTEVLDLEYAAGASAALRADIHALPGDGPVRGVWFYKGTVYGFRDDTSGSPDVCKMYKSTAGGWVEVTFAFHLAFDAALAAGEALVLEGATVNGQTSGATATVARVNIVGGWSGGVGLLALTGITGTFQDNENLRVGSTAVATINGTVFTPTWTDGGRYRFRTYNFFGAANKRRMYGVNGLDYGFEYDDTDGVLAAISTGMTVDAPTRVGVQANGKQLMYGFAGGSVQLSGVGGPSTWTVSLGAAELMVGDDITDFLEAANDLTFIFTRSTTKQLLGNAADGYQLKDFDAQNGAIANSVQQIGFGIHLDDRGFASLSSTDKFGNYEANTFSRLIQPLVATKLKTTTVTESVIYRTANRYRIFFEDGTFISIGVSGAPGDAHQEITGRVQEILGHMPCSYGLVVRCAVSEEDVDGAERLFFGSDDGYIYEAQVGTSLDGEDIEATLVLPYHHSGRPARVKTYRRGRLEAVLNSPATITVQPSLNFGKTQLAVRDISSDAADGEEIERLKSFRLGADGINISLTIEHVSAIELPHTLRAVLYQTSVRGIDRRSERG